MAEKDRRQRNMSATLQGHVLLLLPTAAAIDAAAAEATIKQTNAAVTAVTCASGDDLVALARAQTQGAADAVVAFNSESALISTELHALTPLLKAGGVLHLYAAGVQDEHKGAVLMALMIEGLVDAEEAAAPSDTPFASLLRFSAKKPEFTCGTSAAISIKKAATATKSSLPLKKWTVVADDEDEDMIDEDTLLDDTDEVLKAAKDDCGVGVGGKKRACKNCTCGRKDMEDAEKPVVSDQELSQMVSSCGNCFKGDAFRCGSCPFLGKPAFKPGMEKVMLNLDNSDDL